MEVDDIGQAIFGYTTAELPKPEELEGTENWSVEQWQAEFERTRLRLESFFAARDPLVILARTAFHYIVGASQPRDSFQKVRQLEQVEVEIAQAFVLMGGTTQKAVPTSPGNFVRYWAMMGRHIHCFIRKQPEVGGSSNITTIVRGKARLHTLYYRNLFTRADCEATVRSLLKCIDQSSEKILGYRLSDLFEAMVRVAVLVEAKMGEFTDNIVKLTTSQKRSEVLEAISFFRTRYHLAERVWHDSDDRFRDLKDLRHAGFQMSEMAWPWVFMLDLTSLEANFKPSIVTALCSLALPLGSLKHIDPHHIYLNNPIWKKPYVHLGEQGLFVPLPYLVFSFPLAIMEGLIAGHPELESAYEDARAEYLEAEVAAIVSEAMPTAQVHRNVVWTDPETGKRWENDVVALLGNFLFVFEAKSGHIRDSARRGGDLSLLRNFRDLFVEPGLQGWRLQDYLNRYREKAVLRRKVDNSIIEMMLDRPKVVYRYSICFEHFTTITSARYYLKELGLIGDGIAWAPVFTLGELQMIARHLDTELCFQHYLTRRQSLDELIDFDGDEQDILSIYLTNGLWIDPTTIQGRKVMFLEADSVVRQQKDSRKNRREPIMLGVQLPPLWTSVVRELYACGDERHRFDIINVVLNQHPPALAILQRNVRRFRRGGRREDGDTMIVKYVVGKRIFVLACHLAKTLPDLDEWQEMGRHVVGLAADESTVVECASFLFYRRSKENTFDAVSFYRYGFGKKPEDAARGGRT
jgi:hypothetical protein